MEKIQPPFDQCKSLMEIVHLQMKENNKDRSENRNVCKFYPSSVGKCSRAIVYQMLGYPREEMKGQVCLILENGNYMHSRYEHIVGQTGLMIAPEISFEKPEWRISGRSDIIMQNFFPHESSDNIIKIVEPIFQLDEKKEPVRDEEGNKVKTGENLLYEGPDNDVLIVELKSVGDKGFNYIPNEKHILQLQLYFHLTGIKCGMLLYENKNTQMIKEFYYEYDEALVRQVADQVVYVNQYVDEGKLPPREFQQADFECRYCDFQEECWNGKKVSLSLEAIMNNLED